MSGPARTAGTDPTEHRAVAELVLAQHADVEPTFDEGTRAKRRDL
jgi:hypothetical protein